MRDFIMRIAYTRLYAVISILLTAVLVFTGYSSDNKAALTIGMFMLGFNTVIAFNTRFWTKRYTRSEVD